MSLQLVSVNNLYDGFRLLHTENLSRTSPGLSKYIVNLVNSMDTQFTAYQRCLPCHGLLRV